jgi:hypothetical protein
MFESYAVRTQDGHTPLQRACMGVFGGGFLMMLIMNPHTPAAARRQAAR